MNKKDLWLLSELFYPDETSTAFLLTRIAKKLGDKYNVRVICPREIYDEEKKPSGEIDLSAIQIIRVKTSSINKNSSFLKILWKDFKTGIILSHNLYKRSQKGDKVLVVTIPALLLPMVAIVKKIKKLSLSVIVCDVFPENTIPAGIIKSPKSISYRIIKKIFDKSYAAADRLIAIGRDMKDVLNGKIGDNNSLKISIIENWAEQYILDSNCNCDDLTKVNMLFAGNLGRVQGLDKLAECIGESKNSDTRFLFRGTGAMKEFLEEFANKHSESTIEVGGSFKREEQPMIFRETHMAFITLSPDMYGLGVPSKSYNLMAAGKALIFIGPKDSEIWRVVKENDIGYCFEWSQTKEIIEFFDSLSLEMLPSIIEKGRKAKLIAKQLYSESIILNKYVETI